MSDKIKQDIRTVIKQIEEHVPDGEDCRSPGILRDRMITPLCKAIKRIQDLEYQQRVVKSSAVEFFVVTATLGAGIGAVFFWYSLCVMRGGWRYD